MSLVQLLYGFWYLLFPFYVSTDDVGHTGAARNRLYIIMVHKNKVRMVHDPYKIYKMIVKTISKHIKTRPSDYLIASRDEILRDAADVAHVRNKKMTAPKHHQY